MRPVRELGLGAAQREWLPLVIPIARRGVRHHLVHLHLGRFAELLRDAPARFRCRWAVRQLGGGQPRGELLPGAPARRLPAGAVVLAVAALVHPLLARARVRRRVLVEVGRSAPRPAERPAWTLCLLLPAALPCWRCCGGCLPVAI